MNTTRKGLVGNSGDMLVEDYLVAVVSLPAGVFQPYSGVKTSILILDRATARRAKHVAFFKVENDGYDLGAQRRPIAADDLPAVETELAECLRRLQSGEPLDDFRPAHGLVVDKERIGEDGEYSLSGERYRDANSIKSQYEWVTVGDISMGRPQYGSGARKAPFDNKVRYVRITDIDDNGRLKSDEIVSPSITEPKYYLTQGDLLIARSGSVGRTYLHTNSEGNYQFAGYLIRFRIDPNQAIPAYVYQVTKSPIWREWIASNSKTGTLTNINAKQYSSFRLPLPPLEVQREVVAEIEGYQRVIDGARAVVDSWKPHIAVDRERPMVALGELCKVIRGSSPRPKSDPRYYNGTVSRLMVADITRDGMYSTPQIDSLTEEGAKKSRPMKQGDVIITVSGNPGLPTILAVDACIHDGFVGLRDLNESIDRAYLYYNLLSQHSANGLQSVGAIFRNLTTNQVKEFKISFPSPAIQRAVVAEIEAERAVVDGNRGLIERMEGRIAAAMGRVWGVEQ